MVFFHPIETKVQTQQGLQSNLPSGNQQVVSEIVANSRKTQLSWAARKVADRIAVIRQTRFLLVQASLELEAAIRTSRPASQAEPIAEVLSVADSCRFLEREANQLLKPRRLGIRGRPLWLAGVHHEIHREPFGVVLIIGPSNYPFFLPGVQILQALVAGNAVLVKPAEGCGQVMQELADLLRKAGLPQGLLHILADTPSAAQEAIQANIDKVLLTGSAKTGAAVLSQLAPRLIPATMELSGCDAAFVRADADLDLVTKALAFGLRWNQSETCIAPRRVFVHQERAMELERRLGSMVSDQMGQECRTRGARAAVPLLKDAIRMGARAIAGRILVDNQGITTTVLAGASPEMPLLQEDVFAPVTSIVSFRDDEDAIQANNRCPYALGATVFGEEIGARAFALRVPAGGVVINDLIVPTADPRLPFGGREKSGFGTTRGAEGLLDLTTIKVITIRRGRYLFHLNPPHDSDITFYRAYLEAVHGRAWFTRFRGWKTVIKMLAERVLKKDVRKNLVEE